ncbi:MAG: T9SS type A sorting domain-containing protein [Bacteroidetes bacterium]|nr:T9SS type A sorting domain-containing protein [Bacteroidota bacterium]
MTGWFEDTVDFDPGAGIFNIASNGKQDIFIQKLNAGGNFIWAKSIGGSLTDVGRSITTDIFGDILLTGNFRGVVDFDPDTSVFDVSSLGSEAIFIMKLDTAGNLIWAKPTPGNLYSRGYSIATDPLGNVCVTGWYWGKVDFDPGAAYYYMTSKGYDDIFVLKLDVGGNFIWAKSMGSTFPAQVGESITVDTAGNVYTTGYFRGNVDFDPGASTTYIWSNGINDIFIHKLDSGGNFIWVKTMGSSSFDEGRSITSDASGKVYVTGSYRSTVDFDASAATYKLTGSSTGSSFTLKLGPCITYRGIDTLNVCDSLTWIDGNTYFSNNSTDSFLLVAGALNGCDSLVTLNLTLRYSNGNTDVISACDSITWIDGNSYTSSNNTATYSYTNAVGCDSVITLNLTINNNTGIDVISTCNPYKWIDGITYSSTNFTATHTLTNASGCDSVITLNLTINNNTGIDIIWTCNPYKWIDGITYSSTNFTATHTLTNASGCDSVVTLNLTIVIVDVNVSSTATLIIANAIGATYQWLDCNNNYAMLSGKTGKTFSPGMNGDYAVEVAENRCVDTSECTNISALNIKENTLFNNVSIFPNPNSGLVKIELGNLRDVSVKVFTETGQLIYQEEEINTSIYQFELEVAAGVYFLELNAQGEKRRYKLVKE